MNEPLYPKDFPQDLFKLPKHHGETEKAFMFILKNVPKKPDGTIFTRPAKIILNDRPGQYKIKENIQRDYIFLVFIFRHEVFKDELISYIY